MNVSLGTKTIEERKGKTYHKHTSKSSISWAGSKPAILFSLSKISIGFVELFTNSLPTYLARQKKKKKKKKKKRRKYVIIQNQKLTMIHSREDISYTLAPLSRGHKAWRKAEYRLYFFQVEQ